MKLKINKVVRIVLIVSTVIIISIFAIMIFREYTIPVFKEEKIPLYSYSHNGDVKYSVFLKPNILYSQPSIDEGNVYFTELVDHIEASFIYNFECDKLNSFKGEYEINAYLQGYENIRSEDGKASAAYVLWQKEFPIKEKTSFHHKNQQASLKDDVQINFWEYKSIADEIIKSLKVNMPTKLSVVMNVDIKADTGEGLIDDKLTQMIEIPLDLNQFTISKKEITSEPKTVEKTIRLEMPPNGNKLTIYYSIIGVLVLSFILLLLFSTTAEDINPYVKEINNLFKKYGNRFVALLEDNSIQNLSIYKVNSVDDLVRLSDEIGKPIIYQYNKNPMDITEFYIIDNTIKYTFNQKECFEQKRKDAEFPFVDKLEDFLASAEDESC